VLMLSQVSFKEGDWALSDGFYLLVGCPRGHALVSSFSGNGYGVFSQEAQRCVQCNTNEYILDTNSSLVTCKPCPVGATCDGSNLHPKVPGSVWALKNSTSQYILAACPPGYDLLNTAGGVFSFTAQQCSLCPPRYYCSGVASGRLSCPGGTFSPAGSSAAIACTAAVLVEIILSLAISLQDFDPSLQLGYRNALAYTCQVAVDHIVITSISVSNSLRSITSSIQVKVLKAIIVGFPVPFDKLKS
jgi:hypothetical protein